jgi:signal transduction histidine kinase
MVDVILTLDRMLLGNKNIKLINAIDKGLPPVWADENRLIQILHNLVGNGIKFTDSGEVKVSAYVDGKNVDGKNVVIQVSDTGVGIAEGKFSSIFGSFEQIEDHQQRGQSGTGLGLSVTKQLVELHGGCIAVESTLGQGSCFSFSLAVSEVQPTSSQDSQLLSRLHVLEQSEQSTATQPDVATDAQWRVLVVDDEPVNRQVLHNHLSRHNYQLVEAASGQQALTAIEQQGPFELVLLDIMMPKLSGYEVCAMLRQSHTACSLPVIFLTAKNQVTDMVQSFEVGGNDYLSKPVSKQELLTRVETHLKFLDIHRNLEDKVSERTCELEDKTRAIVAAQQLLVQSEKMAALGTLTAGVAHEINNPTNFVHVSSQNLMVDLERFQQFLFDLVADEADDAILASFKQQFAPLYEHLATINNGTERIKTIVKDLRAFTQLDSADCKSVIVTDLIHSTVNLVRTQYQDITEFTLDFKSEPQLSCYPAQLNQVLMNLIVNACHAIAQRQQQSPDRGLIAISCEQLAQVIEIKITDNGCGMSDETKTKLFEPFYTTKDVGEGTGLGLSISFGIIEKHGGELMVESQLGQGAEFTLRLPVM